MHEQLGLFSATPVATSALPSLAPQWWLSDDVSERREGVLRSAEFWQQVHVASKQPYATQESIYAGRLREMAADMEKRPEFYRRKPVGVTDFRWYFGEVGQAT